MSSSLNPTLSLLAKLGAIAAHCSEMLSRGHGFDRIPLEAMLDDPEVRTWIKMMDSMALLPTKR